MATLLYEIPLDDEGTIVLVEAARSDIREGVTLATGEPGKAAAKAARTLADSLDDLAPMLRLIRGKLVDAGPQDFTVAFGLKLGGETGFIVAKGTAEVNLTVTMTWHRPDGS